MNPYLAQRATQNRGWEIPLCVFLISMSILYITVSIDLFFADGDIGAGVIGLIFVFLHVYPTYRTLRSRRFRKLARLISDYLVEVQKETVPVEELRQNLHLRFIKSALKSMINLSYLQNVRLDSRQTTLTCKAIGAGQEEIIVVCSGCGAKNKLVRGRTVYCAYCGNPVNEQQNLKRS